MQRYLSFSSASPIGIKLACSCDLFLSCILRYLLSREFACIEDGAFSISSSAHLWRCSAGQSASADCERPSTIGRSNSVPACIFHIHAFGLTTLVYLFFNLRFNDFLHVGLFLRAGHWCTRLDQPATLDIVHRLTLQLQSISLPTHAS